MHVYDKEIFLIKSYYWYQNLCLLKMLNIRVAVRIRPFSERELNHNDELTVRKDGSSILVTNPKVSKRHEGDSRKKSRRFLVDFCYDPKDPETSTQEAVYEEIGLEVLDSMFGGYNACVLAYGHSASGKTYTMMGVPEDPGLTPRICQGLFDRVGMKFKIHFHVTVSFLEIYNEKVRDLLLKDDGNDPDNFSLRVREHPKLGPYVQDLSHHLVTDKIRLLELLDFGNKRRRTAATENNIHSSRSHAVFTLQFKQTDDETYDIDKSSKVHLVDLAGSERASRAPNKARLKEGANINKSLVTLGNVISALAENHGTVMPAKDHSSVKTWQPFVPYRDSVLTWLLKDTLGGNSNTIMIATVSPASSCLNETINTLRYAKRTKRILNQPIINEDPKVRTIRQLREEVLRLKSMLFSYCSNFRSGKEFSLLGHGNFGDFKNSSETLKNCLGVAEFNNTENVGKKDLMNKSPRVVGQIAAHGMKDIIKNGIEVPNYSDLDIVEEQNLERGGHSKSPGNKSTFSHMLLRTPQISASSNYDAFEINDVKEAGVNGSDIDSLHETAVFSDSLESFMSSILKTSEMEILDTERTSMSDDSILDRKKEEQTFDSETSKTNCQGQEKAYKLCLKRELNCGENQIVPKNNGSKILHKSRPDLIRSLSTNTKEGILSSASQSCTDISNLSRSNSENSWNSQGSLDASPPENKPTQGTNLANDESQKMVRKADFEPFVRKKDKRFEIVEAVTSRLYMTKKKSDSMENLGKREESNENGELEELKLCKRARMKLCDANRKLMLTRKIKKMVNVDTQTDFDKRTVRMKEKYVLTDQRGPVSVEDCGTNTPLENNSVQSIDCNYIISENSDMKIYDSNSSPLAFRAISLPMNHVNRDDDYFSEDSLDTDKIQPKIFSCGSNGISNGKSHKNSPIQYKNRSFEISGVSSKVVSCKFDPPKIVQKQIQVTLVNDLKSVKDDLENPPLKKENVFSSENSITSTESTDAGACSETSSEDFVFYDKITETNESNNKIGMIGDRELYTITENSEHSDPGDLFSSADSVGSASPLSMNEVARRRLFPNSVNFSNENRVKVKDGTSGEFSGTPAKTIFLNQSKLPFKTGRFSSDDAHAEPRELARHIGPIRRIPGTLELSNKVFFPAYEDAVHPEEESDASETEGAKFADHPGVIKKTLLERSRTAPRDRKINWMELKADGGTQTPFVSFNIRSSPARPHFSSLQFDTHIFKEDSKKDKSTETVFGSEDSITFVFMGPAKPKTSVLTEVIKRSLNKRPIKEMATGQRKSRSKVVQRDSKLMRSLSVDTALLALSRIAKQLSQDVPRTISLDNLRIEEILLILEQGNQAINFRENSCQCDLDAENMKIQSRSNSIRYSVSTGTTRDQQTETVDKFETDFDSSKVCDHASQWCAKLNDKETNQRESLRKDAQEIELKEQISENYTMDDSNSKFVRSGSHTRRVRFLKPDNSLQKTTRKKELGKLRKFHRPTKTFCKFLKEATTLLKNLNYLKTANDSVAQNKSNKMDKKYEMREFLRSNSPFTNGDALRLEESVQTDNAGIVRNSVLGESYATARESLTWPRRQSATDKPPSGMKSRNLANVKIATSRTASLSPYLIQNGHSDVVKIRGKRFSSGPGARDLICKEFSTRESQVRKNFMRKFSSRRLYSDVAGLQEPYWNTVTELESELEESCRRLKLAAEQDEIRQDAAEERLQAQKKTERGKSFRNGFSSRCFEDCLKQGRSYAIKSGMALNTWMEEVKDRRTNIACGRECLCRGGGKESCRCPSSKAVRSTFELNTFGPGSNHCRQFCIFCRKKDSEFYSSTPSLNSNCPPGRCRLNYYGHCPCSGVKLRHITTSPRAYMQHLLTLRRRIVDAT